MRTPQKASEVIQLPMYNYKLQNTHFGVNQYMYKFAFVMLTEGHRISLPLLHAQCLPMNVIFPSFEKKNANKKFWNPSAGIYVLK